MANAACVMIFGKFLHAGKAEDMSAGGDDWPEVGLQAD